MVMVRHRDTVADIDGGPVRGRRNDSAVYVFPATLRSAISRPRHLRRRRSLRALSTHTHTRAHTAGFLSLPHVDEILAHRDSLPFDFKVKSCGELRAARERTSDEMRRARIANMNKRVFASIPRVFFGGLNGE